MLSSFTDKSNIQKFQICFPNSKSGRQKKLADNVTKQNFSKAVLIQVYTSHCVGVSTQTFINKELMLSNIFQGKHKTLFNYIITSVLHLINTKKVIGILLHTYYQSHTYYHYHSH